MQPLGSCRNNTGSVVRFPAARRTTQGLSKRVHDTLIPLAIWAPHARTCAHTDYRDLCPERKFAVNSHRPGVRRQILRFTMDLCQMRGTCSSSVSKESRAAQSQSYKSLLSPKMWRLSARLISWLLSPCLFAEVSPLVRRIGPSIRSRPISSQKFRSVHPGSRYFT